MNFDFSDEQKEIRRQARKFFDGQGTCTAARAVLDGGGDAGIDRETWAKAAEMGWLGAAIPERYGGVGLGMLELCVLAEEIGRAASPIPFSSSIAMAAEAIKLAGSDAQKEKYLPKLAAGSLIATMAWTEAGQSSPLALPVAMAKSGKLTGVKVPVADAGAAGLAVVTATSGSGYDLYLVDLAQHGVTVSQVEAIDLVRGHGEIRFEQASAEALGKVGEGAQLIERLLDIAAVLTAFEQLGAAEAAMQMALEHAKERYAFGRPVGGNQAIKHKLADMFVKNQTARAHCYYGAWALDSDASELPLAAAGARLAATDAFDFAAQENVEIHGGIGFTWESDCQFFYRRARLLALNLGPRGYWTDRLVTQLHGRNR